jgi:hypothetical protein
MTTMQPDEAFPVAGRHRDIHSTSLNLVVRQWRLRR